MNQQSKQQTPLEKKPPALGVIFLGRKRPGFDMEWGRQMEGRARQKQQECGCAVVEPPEKAVDDSTLRQAIEACKEKAVDALVLLQTTMADGRLAPTLAQLWPDPPVLWATPEKPEGDSVGSCSLVGTHAWASTLRQMGHPFQILYGDPGAAETGKQVREAVHLAATVHRLRQCA